MILKNVAKKITPYAVLCLYNTFLDKSISPDKKNKIFPAALTLIFNHKMWFIKLRLEPAFSSIRRTTLFIRSSQTAICFSLMANEYFVYATMDHLQSSHPQQSMLIVRAVTAAVFLPAAQRAGAFCRWHARKPFSCAHSILTSSQAKPQY